MPQEGINRWDGLTTAELKVLASWAYQAGEAGELDTRQLRADLRAEIDRRYASDFGGTRHSAGRVTALHHQPNL